MRILSSLLILSSTLLASTAARAEAPAAMLEICHACQTQTLQSIVEHQMSPELKASFNADLRQEGIPYEDVKNVRFTYDGERKRLWVAGDNEASQPVRIMMFLGAHVGAYFPLGFDAIATISSDSRPRWDFDASWEPSNYIQSYSVGAAFHPFHNAWFIGARIREVQMHAPWSRGYDSRFDNQWGGGAELGLRGRLWGSRFLGSFSLGAFYVTNDLTSAPILYTLNVGLAYGVAGNE